MRKILSYLFVGILIIFSLSSHAGGISPPDMRARQFYDWYIKKQSHQVFPLLDRQIATYVDMPTLEGLRKDYKRDRLPGDADYFTKAQDYDERDWLSHIVTGQPIALGEVVVVPVTFGKDRASSVLVFFRKRPDGWKIIKVDDTLAYSSQPD